MKSFGIWYKISENSQPVVLQPEPTVTPTPSNTPDPTTVANTVILTNTPDVDLHINLWNIKNNTNNSIDPFIDFGLIIKNFKNIENIKFLFPFHFKENEFEDLHDKVIDPKIARLIFNDNCDTSSNDNYHYIKNSEDKIEKLIMRLKKSDSDKFDDGVSLEESPQESKEKYITLNIDFSNIIRDDKCGKFKNLYLRFRIKTPNLKQMIFCKLEKKIYF